MGAAEGASGEGDCWCALPGPRWGSPLNRWVVAAASVVMMAGLGSFNA